MRTCSRCGRSAAATSPHRKRATPWSSALIVSRLAQLVRIAGREVEPVDRPQRLDLLQCRRPEGPLALEGVQHDALQEVAEGHVKVGGQRLEHLQQAAFQAYPGLGAGDGLHVTDVT